MTRMGVRVKKHFLYFNSVPTMVFGHGGCIGRYV